MERDKIQDQSKQIWSFHVKMVITKDLGIPKGSYGQTVINSMGEKFKGEQISMHARLLSRFSCVRLCDLVDCSPPGSSVH